MPSRKSAGERESTPKTPCIGKGRIATVCRIIYRRRYVSAARHLHAAQLHVRHLRVRFEEKEGNFGRIKVRPLRMVGKRVGLRQLSDPPQPHERASASRSPWFASAAKAEPDACTEIAARQSTFRIKVLSIGDGDPEDFRQR